MVDRVRPWGAGTPPPAPHPEAAGDGRQLLLWLGHRDRRGLAELAKLLPREQPCVDRPLLPDEPTDLPSLAAVGDLLGERLASWSRYLSRSS